jgi:hypothetical protein
VFLNDSEEIDSEEDDEVPIEPQKMQAHPAKQPQQQKQAATQPNQQREDDDDEEDKAVPGAYNPMQFANLPVSAEIKELFEYI